MSHAAAEGILRSGWSAATLADVASWSSGGTPQAGNPAYYGGEIPWAVIGDLTDGLVHTTASHLTDVGLANSSAKIVPAGTVLVAMYGSIGKLGVAARPMATNQAIACAVPYDGTDRQYLYWWLRSQRGALLAAGKGGAQQNISQTILRAWPIHLAPLSDQRHIAARLDEIDARSAAAAAHIRAARSMAGRLRTAVLASAYAQACDRSGSGPAARLEDLLREPLKNGYSARPVNRETPYRVLTLTATTSGVFDPHHFKYTDESFSGNSPLWLVPGDLLIQRGNTAEYVGVPALYNGDPGKFIYPDLMIRARIRRDIEPRYVWYMLLAPQARNFLRERATGTAGNMPKINQATLKALPVPLPPSEVRAAIVERLDRAFEVADATVRRLDRAAAELVRTKERAFAKAFRGELVPAEAALAEGGPESGEQVPARRPLRSVEPPRRRTLDREESVAAKRGTRHG